MIKEESKQEKANVKWLLARKIYPLVDGLLLE